MKRRWRVLGALATSLAAAGAAAQAYPSRPIRIVVGFVAGSGTDLAARVIAQRLPEHVGQTALVENRPGAGGAIAAEQVVRAAPDGHTLLMTAAADAVQPAIRPKMPFDVLRDLAPITPVVAVPFLLVVHPVVPVRSASDLIVRIVATPQVRDGISRQGLLPTTSTPEAFAEFIRDEVAQNVKLVQSAGAVRQ